MIMHVEHARFTLLAIMLERDLDVGNSSETLMSGVGGGLDARPIFTAVDLRRLELGGFRATLFPKNLFHSEFF